MSAAGRGRPKSAEHRAKIGAAHRGRVKSPEHRAKISAACLGRQPSPETRAKLSAAGRARTQSVETRAKISAALTGGSHPSRRGIPLTPETREKLRAAHLGKVASAETRAKISASRTGLKVSPEARAAMSARRRGVSWTPRQRAGMEAYWADESRCGEAKERSMRIACAAQGSKSRSGTRIELAVRAELDRLGIKYQIGQCIVGYFPDILLPARHVVIECDGTYWHSLPNAPERDRKRDAKLLAAGYRTVRLSQVDIKRDVKAAVRAALVRPPPSRRSSPARPPQPSA